MIGGLLCLLLVAYVMRGPKWWRSDRQALALTLASGEAAGIISGSQREQLLAHAAEQSSGRRLGATWLAIVAGLFVAAGVSLLIARNWEMFGPLVRVAVFLAALLAVGEAAIRCSGRTAAVALPLELLWLLLPLLGIGLYGQTFQLSGDTILPLLAWLLLTAPLAWLSARPVAATLHTLAMVLVLFAGNFVVDAMVGSVAGAPSVGNTMALVGNAPTVTAWGLSALLLGAMVVQSLRLLPEGHRHHFFGVCALWLFTVLAVCNPLRLENPAWLALAAAALIVLCLALHLALDTSMVERRSSASAWIGGVYAMTFLWHVPSASNGDVTVGGIAVTIVAGLVAVVVVLSVPLARLSPSTGWARLAKLVLLVPLASAAVLVSGRIELWWAIAVLMNALLLAVGVGLMWHGSLLREVAQINAGVVIVVALLVTRFLDLFGSMLRSGIGFIAAGIALAALAWALERTRRRLIHVPAEASQ